MSKEYKLYTLWVIATPIALVAYLLAVAEGSLRSAIALGVGSAVWGVCILTLARKLSRRREANEAHHTANKTPLRRRLIILEKTFWLLILAGTAASLYKALVNDAPMYVLFEVAWLTIISSGHLFLIGLVTAAKDVTDF